MLAFIHIAKNAGTTVSWILRSSFGIQHCDVQPWHARRTPIPFSAHDLQRLHRLYPRLDSIAGHRVTPYAGLEEACPHIQYFTLLREPLKRCASYYQYVTQWHGERRAFEDWIQTEWPRNRETKMLAGAEDAGAAVRMIREKNIFIGLTEWFDESLLLFKYLVASDLDISYERLNVARDNAMAQDLLTSERTRQMLAEANQLDLELYEYVRHELYPSYRREYGASLDQDVAAYQQNQGKFNRRNIIVNRVYRNLVYKPALKIYRLRRNRLAYGTVESATRPDLQDR
ncbi:MAG: hypothetical protein ACFFA6_09425 [Promethearchaeota archaeon]